MTKKRSELREKIMIILYQWDLFKDKDESLDIDIIIKNNISLENDFVKEVVYGVVKNLSTIDELANKYMDDWTIDRLDKTGCAILRMAIYELLYMDTPNIVVINEAVELSKKYSDDSVRKIINAVLDKINLNI